MFTKDVKFSMPFQVLIVRVGEGGNVAQRAEAPVRKILSIN